VVLILNVDPICLMLIHWHEKTIEFSREWSLPLIQVDGSS
jgi:hypothetical protein